MAKAQIEEDQDDLFDDDDLEVDVVDDRPEEDQVPPKKKVEDEDDADDIPEDELSSYSEGVQKRIKRLRYEYHEERRAREAASKQSEEAVRYAQSIHHENVRLKKMLEDGSQQLSQAASARHEAEMKSAQKAYKEAFESGDTDALMESQNKINEILLERASSASRPAPAPQREAQQPQQRVQQDPSSMVPDQKFVSWSRRNKWFGDNPEMTSFAYGVHERLVKSGVDPQSKDYYDKIDARMRQVFPDEFEDEYSDEDQPRTVETQTATYRKKPTVAPGGRGNGKPPRKVQLTRTQVAVAKRLGLTPEQYAKQVAKEMANGA